ncbi:MAG: D-alanyl-D-alanine carboxypeptidase family protein [Christensenellales bacterium]|jgi:D-alanyl-D-alanine carboxypeptidase (penicillin-binding protein 5/6)
MARKIACALLAACILALAPGGLAKADTPFEINAKAAILVDADTGTVVLSKNEDAHLPVASVSKIMTILLCMEAIERGEISLDDLETASENAAGMGGSQVLIETGGQYSVGDLMKSIIVASGNDASVMMAEILCGSEEVFIRKMNERAKELGMTNTHFTNCTGLTEEDNYSSAADVAVMSRELLRHPLFFQYSTIWLDELKHPADRVTMITNTNKMIRQYPGCDGIKTGSTSAAGFCISATATKNDTRLIAVILGSQTSAIRFEEAAKLLNYGFANYETHVIMGRGEAVALDVPVTSGRQDRINGIVPDRVSVFLEKGSQDRSSYTVDIFEGIKAPVKKGQKIGEVVVSLDNEIVCRYDVVSDRDVEAAGVWDYFRKIIGCFMSDR